MPGLTDAQEAAIAPDGRYNVQVTKATWIEEKNYVQIILAFDTEENYADIFHIMSLPKDDDEDKTREFKNLLAKRFLAQFNLDIADGIDTELMLGATAESAVKKEEYNGNWKNTLVLDQLASE